MIDGSMWLRRLARLTAIAALLCAGLADDGRAQEMLGEQHRCVIEPALRIKVGSPAVGLLSEVPVQRGGIVKQGDVIARLESSVEQSTLALNEVRAANGAEIAASRARLQLLRRQLDRAEALLKQQAASEETVDERRAQVEVERQSLEQAKLNKEVAELELERSKALLDLRLVRSPIDGVVTERKLSAGEYVHQETYIVELAQLDPLYVEVYLPSALYRDVQMGMRAEVVPQAPFDGVYEAKVIVVDRVLDAASNTFGVRLALPNSDLALPGGIRCMVRFPELTRQGAAG